MKHLKTISKEIKKALNIEESYITTERSWIYYESISECISDFEYVSIYLKHTKREKYIEICHTTDNPNDILKLIKAIEPDIEVHYTKITEEKVII